VDEACETQGTYENINADLAWKSQGKISLFKPQHVREEYSKTDLTQDYDITHSSEQEHSRYVIFLTSWVAVRF